MSTIAAIATPPGRGGIGVVRVSGPLVERVAQSVLGRLPPPRQAVLATFRDESAQALDQGIALYFAAPNSFTGEAVLELQGHGGTVVLDQVLSAVLQCGVRLARPGEFSERAFLNGKIDLVQAEAIADLIDSESTTAARSAMRSLQGHFSRQITQISEALTNLRCYVEAGIDFPDEEIDVLADGQVAAKVEQVRSQLENLLAQAQQGTLLQEGMNLVIIGAPNVGKSSLLNCLAGRETAIVTDHPGTTRDLICERIHLEGMPLHITDTAGLRDTPDPIEQEGIRRARHALTQADCALLLVDDRYPEAYHALRAELPPNLPYLVVRNKCDISGQTPEQIDAHQIRLCAKTGDGVTLLQTALKQRMNYQGNESGLIMARRRHLDALRNTHQALENTLPYLASGEGELIAEELRQAQQHLGQITGSVTSEDLLGKIFASFCIGK